jgi:hypothetical protein
MIMEPTQLAKPAASNGSVMDIRAPKAPELPKPAHDETPAKDEPAKLPVHIEANDRAEDVSPTPHQPVVQRDRDVRRAQAAKAKSSGGHGVGLAIAATVIVVLGLGALFTYAYLRTNGIVIL